MDINKYSPKYKVSQGHLLRLSDVTAEDIFEFLYLAKALKKKFNVGEHTPVLKNKTIALLFDKVSTRTRISFDGRHPASWAATTFSCPKARNADPPRREHQGHGGHARTIRHLRAGAARLFRSGDQ